LIAIECTRPVQELRLILRRPAAHLAPSGQAAVRRGTFGKLTKLDGPLQLRCRLLRLIRYLRPLDRYIALASSRMTARRDRCGDEGRQIAIANENLITSPLRIDTVAR
jgi:hypothetical protein